MAKVNAWLARQQAIADAKAKIRQETARRFALQQAQDIAVITLNRVFGFGAERAREFVINYNGYFEAYADMAIADSKDDDSIEYTRAKMDGVLKEILGDYFVEWDERYKWVFELDERMQNGERSVNHHNKS